MTRIRNVSPWGDLSVPLIGVTVASGEEAEVLPEHAEVLLDQPDNWALADGDPISDPDPVQDDASPRDESEVTE